MYNEQIIFNNVKRPTFVMPRTAVDKGPVCAMHFHSELEFLYVNSGTMKYCTDDTEYIARQGDVMFINSKVPHCTEALTDNCSHSFIQFKEPKLANDQLRRLARFLKLSDIPSYHFVSGNKSTDEISKHINEIIKYFDSEEIHYDYYINGVIYMILAMLYKMKILTDSQLQMNTELLDKLSPVFDYIHENYSGNLNLEVLSKILNLNEHYFCRLFKKATGNNITDYINFIRIYNAEKLMSTDMNISEIAENTGFSSLSYFNKIFKKYKQYTPSEFKKMAGQKEGLIK